jgi:hypothetical protein
VSVWRTSFVVEAPIEVAFERLIRPAALGRLGQNGEITGPERLALGATFSNRGRTGGLPSVDTSTVSAFEPPRRLTFTTRSRGLGGRVPLAELEWSYRLRPLDERRTEVTHALEASRTLGVVPVGWVWKLVPRAVLERTFLRNSMATLASRLEGSKAEDDSREGPVSPP